MSFFIDRPIFAMVLSIVIVLIGGLAMFALPIAQYPEITPPTIVVTTTYPGANAQDVAAQVATPIEKEINGVENMLYMESKSTNDGQLNLTITFNLGTEPRHGPGARAKPRVAGPAETARRREAARRVGEKVVAEHHLVRQLHLARRQLEAAWPEQLRSD